MIKKYKEKNLKTNKINILEKRDNSKIQLRIIACIIAIKSFKKKNI